MRRIYYLLAIVFWPLYYVSLDVTRNTLINNAILILMSVPALVLVLFGSKKKSVPHIHLPQHYFFIFLILIAFYRFIFDSDSLLSKLSDVFSVFSCAVFWFYLDTFIGRKKANQALFLSSGIVFFLLLLPQYIGSLSLGSGIVNAFKRVDFESLRFVKSTIEVYLWIGVFISFLVTKKKSFLKYVLLAIFTIFIVASGKRSLLIFFVLILALTQLSFLRKRFYSFSYFIPLLPVIFYFFSYTLLLLFSGNDLIYSMLVTTSLENFQTGSGRLIMWYDLILVFFEFDAAHLINGVQDFQFWKYFDDSIYFNLHNTYLQVFYKNGYLLFFFLIVVFFKYLKRVNGGFKSYNISLNARSFLFLLILLFSNTEALLRIETTHCLIAITILSLRNEVLKHD